MSVSTPFIERPVATSLLGIAVLLVGILGFRSLPVSSLPQVDFPTIEVVTQLPGGNPDTIASIITAPLERQFGQIAALATMTSESSFGRSSITLQFQLDRDIDGAAQDVQSAINAAASSLPRNLPYPPVYSKVNPADTPIVTLALTSSTESLRTTSDLADTLIAPRLSQIAGVGHVSVEGGIRPAVRIQADLARLANYRLGLEDLRAAIVAANVAGSKGSLDGAQQSYTISANDQISAAKAYESIFVAYRNGAPVLLKNVADVVDGLENARVAGWYQGEPAVILDVQRQPGANVVETADLVKKELPRLQRSLPKGATLAIVHDRTETIRASIADVEFTLALSALLVVGVVLLFLRTLRATIIAGVALPLSIIATFAVMWYANFSLDNLSMMALTIGTGFVVDDAIVMIENIVRKIELGMAPRQAALEGAGEIGFTVISLTVSLIAVFIPLLFMTGLVGRMFREFALTLSIAVVVSAIVSLTLTPMMCSLLLKVKSDEKPGILARIAEAPFDWMAAGYGASLGWAMRHRGTMLLITLATLALTTDLYIKSPKGFLPSQDTGLLAVVLEGNVDASFAEMSRLQERVAQEIRRDPDVSSVISVVGIGDLNPTGNIARLTVTLRPRAERTASAAEIGERLRAATARIPGTATYLEPVQDIQITTRVSRSQYQYTLAGADAGEVSSTAGKLVRRLATSPALANVALETQIGGLEARVHIEREQAGRLGISVQSIDDTLNDAFGQRQISTIYAQSNQYRVILEAGPRYQTDPNFLDKIYVNGNGQQIPLGAFSSVERSTAPLSISHQEQFPAAVISFDLAPGASLDGALAAIQEAQTAISMPATVIGTFSADAAEFEKSLANEPLLILAAVVVIYLVLGVLYESFAHPVTILSTLPSAGVGALIALNLAGLDLSIIALIGIVLLMGIVKKNAIMMIDFALEAERHEGLDPEAAIVKACHLRFRPIMMTTLAALLGAVPLAFAHGTGSELRVPLGVTIIGGLLLSQLLTLYTTPVIYLMVDWVSTRLGGRQRISGPIDLSAIDRPDAVSLAEDGRSAK
ncbi:MAG: efflux RND transporter permease subunit [Ancalomicrobiaceae bacterium]|nr:efflux RND transporter permease subunit [Ancalomicrobiaceae bacterium]